MAIGNHNDLTHIVRTSDQWKNTYDKYELIPVGVLCVELVSSDVTKIKIGDGHNIFSKLPYIGDLDLSKYYTKLETDTRIKEILTQEKVVRIKGIIGSKSDLPADARCGDIYFVRQLSSSDNKYIEYIYSPDNTWEPLGGIPIDIDLSEYAKTAYVDDKIEQVNERIDDIEQHGTHTHPNKEILDQITEPYTTADKETLASLHNYDDTEIREMISQSSHTHANKDILDATSAAFTREDKSKLDQLNPYDDSTIKERITELERVAHEHSNKRILDQTTASFTKEYERKMRWIRMYTGCTGMEEGIAGLVPAAQAGEEDYVLSGSGEWVPQTGGGGTYELPIATASTLGGIKVGDGLEIDANGKLSVVGGGGGGDSIAEGDGITITTDPQTGVKTISVNTGDGLQINQDGEVEIDPSIIPEVSQYYPGEAIDITASSDSNLPAGYAEVDYVEAPGNAYTIIDYIPNRNTKIVGTAMMIDTSRDPVVFGARTGNSGQQFVFWFNRYSSTQAKVGFVYGTNTWSTSTDCDDGKLIPYVVGDQFTFLLSLEDEFNVNGEFVHNITENGTPASDIKLGIFALTRTNTSIESNDNIFKGRIYEFKIYENDELVVNLVPAIYISTGSVGFYDTIGDTFYTSRTSTSFICDPSTVHVSGYLVNVKYNRGLTVNQDNELEVNIGSGLSINQDNELEIDPSIIPEVIDYNAGEAIDISPNGTDLPAGYADISYIESTGSQWTQLDYYANNNSRVVVDYLVPNTVSTVSDVAVFGSGAGSSQAFVFWDEQLSNNQKGGFVYGSNSWSSSTDANRGRNFNKNRGEHTILDCSVNGCFIDNNLLHGITPTGNFDSTVALGIFASANGDQSYGYGIAPFRIYSFKIYENDALEVDLRPALRLSDNKPGFYDIINDDFYPSLTSTEFVYDSSSIDTHDDIFINVKYNKGLTVNQDNELEVNLGSGLSFNQNGEIEADQYTLPTASASTLGGIKVGDGLSIESDGTLSVVGGGSSGGGPEYAEGDAIEINTQSLSFNVDAIRWDISDIKSLYQQGGPYTQVRSVEFCDSSNVAHALDSGSAIWSDGDTVSYPSVSETIDELVADTGKLCAVWRYPNHVLKLTFNLDTTTPLSDIVKFRMKTANDTSERDPKAWKIYVRNATTQQWYLVHEISDAEITGSRDTWSDYYTFTPVTETSINVKYGTGLTLNASNELEVDPSIIPEAPEYRAGDAIEIAEATSGDEFRVLNQEYFFDTRGLTCGLNARVWTTVNDGDILAAMCIHNSGGNQVPLFVGLTEDSVKVSQNYNSTILGPNGSFDYRGKTWYFTADYALSGTDGQDTQGHIQTLPTIYSFNSTPSNFEPAAKDLIDLAVLLSDLEYPTISVKYNKGLTVNQDNELEVNIGNRLHFDSNNALAVNPYYEGEGISIHTMGVPTGYTRVKALSSTDGGNQYIDTGYKINPNTVIELSAVFYKYGSNQWKIPLGTRNASDYASNGMLFLVTWQTDQPGNNPSLWIERVQSVAPSDKKEEFYNDIVNIRIAGTSLTCTNTRTGITTVLDTAIAMPLSQYNLFVFATNDHGSMKFHTQMDLYSLTISESDTVIHQYIPCKRDSDNKCGLYDTINQEFKLSPNNALFTYVAGAPSGDTPLMEEISLLPATEDTLGGIKIGDGLAINEDGIVSTMSVEYEAGQGIEFITTESEDGFNVKNKEYYFTDTVSCQINGTTGPRTYTRTSTDPCLLAIAQVTANNTIWTAPLAVGLTENSVKYSNSYDGVIVGPDDSFEYKGYTWYITYNYGLMNSSGVDLMGNVPSIDMTSLDISDRNDLYLMGQALIDTAELIRTIISMDVWNGGTGWTNGDYYSGTSDTFTTDWYYTYHYDPTAYIPVPEGALKVRVIGISNENDSHFEGGGVNIFDSNHHHIGWQGCCTATSEWVDILEGTVYVQPEVKWNNNNTRTISSSDIKSVTLQFWYSDPKNNAITAKLGNGLEFDENNAIQVKLGDGLTIDEDGAIEVTGGGGGGDSIAEGDGITITTDSQTGVKTIGVNTGAGLDIDPLTNELFVNGQLPEGTIIKKLTYVGNGEANNIIQFTKKPLGIITLYGQAVNNKCSAVPTVIDANVLMSLYGSGSTSESDRGGTVCCEMSYNDITNELTLSKGLDAGARYNISGETYQMYYLTKGHTGSGTSVNNEVSVIKTMTYIGDGTGTIDIQFSETPDMIVSIYGPTSDGFIASSPVPITSTSIAGIYEYGSASRYGGVVSCGMSFNDSTNILTLSGGVDAGARFNISGATYIVTYSVNEVIPSTMPYDAGEAISIETIGGLQPTNYSNNDFVDSIVSMNAGSIVKAADNSSFTLTASGNDCYTRGSSGQANGSYPFNVKASTKYRFAWDSADPTVHGKVYTYENGLYDVMMHEIDQYDSSYLEFTTSPNTTFIQARFGVMYAGDSITYSNVRLYEVIEDENQYNEISVKHGDGLTVNEQNELEVSYRNGLEIVSNSQYRPEYYFNTQVQCQVHTDNYYTTPASFDRTYQKTTTEPALCCIWEVGDSGALWTGPLLVGTSATSVQYTTADTQQTVTYQNTFQYLGQTWYTSGYPDFLNAADHEDKLEHLQYLGSYPAVSDQIRAAKDLIDLALINAGSLQVKLGSGLSFDANGAIQVTGGGGGSGDTVTQGAGIEITTDQQTGNKVIAVNAGTGLQVDQTTNELEIDDSVVTEDDELSLVFVPDDYQPS